MCAHVIGQATLAHSKFEQTSSEATPSRSAFPFKESQESILTADSANVVAPKRATITSQGRNIHQNGCTFTDTRHS